MTDQPSTVTTAAFTEDDTVALRAERAVSRAVRSVADRQSPGDFHEAPLFEGDPFPARVPNAVAQLRALVALRGRVETETHYAVRAARGEGVTWHDLAGVLELTDDKDDGLSPAERAWYAVMPEDHNWGITRPYFGYSCGACTNSIRDFGPFESHPDDNEEGHAGDCARHAELVAAWEAKHRD